MLHVASVCTPCCMLLDVTACCCTKFETGQTCQPTTSTFFFGSVCAALPTLLGPHTLITHGLQILMGCILPTMHCRSQTCWELLHPFAHHCQHARNNSQNCWRNNVGSCCARLHAALNFLLFTIHCDPSKTEYSRGKIKLVLLIASQTFFRLIGSSFVSG